MKRTLLAGGLAVLIGVLVMIAWAATDKPCPSQVAESDLLYNALAVSFFPPNWDKPKLLAELKKHAIPYREQESQVLIPACGANWLGKQWW